MKSLIPALFLGLCLMFSSCEEPPPELPNILWITSEDNGMFLGCYGDAFATTPHLDRLAEEGFRYTHAYANTPVCARHAIPSLQGYMPVPAGTNRCGAFTPNLKR